MGEHSNRAFEVCNSRFKELNEAYNGAHGQILVSHFGEFSQESVDEISSRVEQDILEKGESKGIVKRVFSILIEALQNIRLHGERDDDGMQTSFLVVGQNDDEYSLAVGNLIRNRDSKMISENLDKINQLDRNELKELYMEVLTNGMISSRGGAGLGFITIAMKAKHELNYDIKKVDDQLSCFTVETKIKRKKKKK